MKKILLNIIFISIILNLNSYAVSQDRSDEFIGLEEIIVTSQKKASGVSVQDTPIAITAFDDEKIEGSFSTDLRDLARFAPNVELDTSATFVGYPNFYIRGIGVNGSTRTADPAVGIFMNGVYLGYSPSSLLDTFDLESVEVLRGPQGTLFGRNVTGGAISVRTKRPGDEYKTSVKLTVGDYGRLDISAAVDIPFSETIKARLSVIKKNRDGFWKDNNGGSVDGTAPFSGGGMPASQTGDKPQVDNMNIRGTLVFDFSEKTDLTLIGEYYTSDDGPANSRNIIHKAVPKLAQTLYGYTPPSDPYEINHNDLSDSSVKTIALTAELNHDLGHGILTGVYGYRELDHFDSSTDFDGTPYTLFHFPDNTENQHQNSAEIRYASNFSEIFEFTAGLYFFEQNFFVGEKRAILYGLSDINQAGIADVDHEIQAIFAQGQYNFNEKFSLTLGGRYTEEEKSILFSPPGTCELDFSSCTKVLNKNASFESFTPHLALNYNASDDLMYYVSYTEGYRSGTFNQRAQTVEFLGPAEEESVTSYEVGLKSMLLDNRLLLNVALFKADYDDIQAVVNTDIKIGDIVTSGQVLANAATAEISGIEIELVGYISSNLKVNLSLGHLDAEYKDFTGLDIDKDGDIDADDSNASSSLIFARVPEYTWNFGFEYDYPLTSGQLTLRGDYSYKDDYFTDLFNDPEIMQEGFGVVDASLTYYNDLNNYRISLYGRNIGNEDYFEFAANVGTIDTVTWGGAPERFGIEFGFEF